MNRRDLSRRNPSAWQWIMRNGSNEDGVDPLLEYELQCLRGSLGNQSEKHQRAFEDYFAMRELYIAQTRASLPRRAVRTIEDSFRWSDAMQFVRAHDERVIGCHGRWCAEVDEARWRDILEAPDCEGFELLLPDRRSTTNWPLVHTVNESAEVLRSKVECDTRFALDPEHRNVTYATPVRPLAQSTLDTIERNLFNESCRQLRAKTGREPNARERVALSAEAKNATQDYIVSYRAGSVVVRNGRAYRPVSDSLRGSKAVVYAAIAPTRGRPKKLVPVRSETTKRLDKLDQNSAKVLEMIRSNPGQGSGCLSKLAHLNSRAIARAISRLKAVNKIEERGRFRRETFYAV